MALFAVTGVALLSVGFLQVSSALGRHGSGSVDVKRALYLAEAGLSEAYFALGVGKTGQVGSEAEPVLFGDGVFWVEATPFVDGTVQLESTGLCGAARVELGLAVARLDSRIGRQGFFSDAPLEVEPGTHVDSYDSRTGPYAGQVGQLSNLRARLGSNGAIVVNATGAAPTEVRGELVPGVGAAADLDLDVVLTGASSPRGQTTILPRVEAPAVPLAPGVQHSGAAPLTITGTAGYESLAVGSGSVLRIVGPAVLVVGELSAADGAAVEFDTASGPVELVVLDSASFDAGAAVTNTTADPTAVSLLVAARLVESGEGGEAEPALAFDAPGPFHGFLYAPRAAVRLGPGLELFGAAVAAELDLAPNARLHFDLALESTKSPWGPAPQVISWRVAGVREAVGVAAISPFHALGVERADLAPPGAGHDLAGVGIKVTYLDLGGTQRRYRGPEAAFDWSLVGSVVDSVRSSPVTEVAGVEVVRGGAVQLDG